MIVRLGAASAAHGGSFKSPTPQGLAGPSIRSRRMEWRNLKEVRKR